MASSTEEDAVHLWRVDNGQLLHTVEGHRRPVLNHVFQDNETLLTSTDENVLRYWDIGGCTNQSEGCGTLQRTLDESAGSVSATLFGPERKRWVTINEFNVLRMWQTSDGQRLRTSTGFAGWADNVAIHPEGTLLALTSWDDILVWNMAGGDLFEFVQAHKDRIYSLAFSPDGTALASASADGTVRLWQVEDWSLLHTLEGHEGTVRSLAFGPDSQSLASSGKDGAIHIWRVADGRLLHSLDGGPGPVNGIAISPDGKALASGSRDNTVRLWSAEECLEQGVDCGKRLGILSGRQDNVQDLAFAANGQLLISGSKHGNLRFWDVADCSKEAPGCGRLLHTVATGPASCVELSPDGTLLASNAPWVIQLWAVVESEGQQPSQLSWAFGPVWGGKKENRRDTPVHR